MSVPSEPIEIDTQYRVNAMAFTTNGEYLISGYRQGGVQVWRTKDGEPVATVCRSGELDGSVICATVSKDGRWIAAGVNREVFVWSATTYQQIFAYKTPGKEIYDIDFSPDSCHLVTADWDSFAATISYVVAHQEARTLRHRDKVGSARYSPRGDRIATATNESVHVWDSKNGRLLINVIVGVDAGCGLLWFNNYLFLKASENKIKQVDISARSIISEWPVPQDTENRPRITMPQHGRFIVYSTTEAITFWDTLTHARLGLIRRQSERRWVAFSPDHRHLAFVEQQRKIVIRNVSLINDPDILIENAALDAWKRGHLADAEALLTAAIPTSKDTSHHVLASRALVRTCLQQCDAALGDAEQSIKIQSSVIGYIAKCMALVDKGDTDAGCRVCDIASHHFHSDHLTLLLIKAVVLFMAGERSDAMSRISDLIQVAYFDSSLYVVQAYMHFLLGKLHMQDGNYIHAIQSLQDARDKLGNCSHSPPLIILLISGWNFDDLSFTIEQQSCEALFKAGRTKEAGDSVLNIVDDEVNMTEPIRAWASDFMQKCLSMPDNDVSVSGEVTRGNDASITQENPHASHPATSLLRGWVRLKLTTDSWKDVLETAVRFTLPRFSIHQAICERLEAIDHVADAVACFHQMQELSQEMSSRQELVDWIRDFKSRCCARLEGLGDGATGAKRFDDAIAHFTVALSLDPATPHDLLVKRSKVYARKAAWDDALSDANKVVGLYPSSPSGYERKHAALHGLGRYDEAIDAFESMVLGESQSSDPDIRERSRRYVTRQQTEETIRTSIQNVIRDTPLVLINTASGRLCNKSEQAAAFESEPTFRKLISAITTQIDHTSIEEEVGTFYRYATFSHKWEENEPLYEMVIRILVYDLEASPTHGKLQMFCKIVREAGFNWAWSDTCCINKADHFVLQEALVSMFKWYEGSAMTIIFLLGVGRDAKRGALVRSIWNMRAWTLQEYHASKVVRFYTQDWTPYLGIDLYNHKDSLEIVSEMEEATGISTRALMAIRPGLDDICEKLRLASTRQTTRIEDAAYSLLGIFSLSLPIVYGEGDKALGRLLAQVLASSGDMSILAWTGRSGRFNSCLPASISVFRHPPTSHIPSATVQDDMRLVAAGLQSLDFSAVTSLYDLVNDLPVPLFSGYRMRLPCLTFKLGPASLMQNRSEQTFRAQANALGVVKIQSEEDLTELASLYLVHPWIDFLLDRQPICSTADATADDDMDSLSVLGTLPLLPSTSDAAQKTRTARLMGRFPMFSTRPGPTTVPLPPPSPLLVGRQPSTSAADTASLSPPSTLSPVKKQMRVLQFMARLRRPFGALLLTPTRRHAEEYRRVAAESVITVQVEELTPVVLDKLIGGVRVLDVL